MERDMDDPRYKALRFGVFSRDNFACVLCLSKNGGIECHHIRRWVDWPQGRYLQGNCVTLCKSHHDEITGNEKEWEERLQKIVAMKRMSGTSKKGKSTYQSNQSLYKRKWKPENPYRRY